MNQVRINKPKRMNGWIISELYFFVERLLHWATFSLRYLFFQLLLLWAASYPGYFFSDSELPPATSMRLAASSCNPKKHKVALWSKTTFRAAVKMRLAASSCNRASHASQHHSAVAACSRANAFWNSWLQTPIAPRWIDQRSRSEDGTIPRYSEIGVF